MRRANIVRQRNGKQLVHKPLPASVCRHGLTGRNRKERQASNMSIIASAASISHTMSLMW